MRLFYVLVFILAVWGPASGAEYWVDADLGNDSNPGTQALPLKTPDVAVWMCGATGGTVHLKGVFYTGLSIEKTHFSEGLVVDGHESALLYAFDGPFKAFDPAAIEVEAFGNVLAACAFLHGLSAEDLTPEELNHHDPDYQLLITVRARKSGVPS